MRAFKRVNAALNAFGERITTAVGTMWAALIFAALTFVSLPSVIASHDVIVIIQWVGSVFLQLVFLPIIMVGQRNEGARTEARDIETHDAVMQEHAETKQILAELTTLLGKR